MKATRAILIATFSLVSASPTYAATVHKNAIQISPYDLSFTKIAIDGRKILALIDSGSFRTVELSSTVARELRLPLTETTKVARRYEGNGFHLMSGRIDRLGIGSFAAERRRFGVQC